MPARPPAYNAPVRGALGRRLTIAFAVPVAALILSVLGVQRTIVNKRGAEATVLRTADAIAEANELLRAAIDAQSGQRGFAISGKREFLAPYHQAVEEFDRSSLRLDAILWSQPDQRRRIEAMRGVFRRWRAEAAEPVIRTVERGPGGMAEAQAMIASARGKTVLDELRRIAAEMIAEQERNLARQQATAEAAQEATTWYTLLGALALVMALLLAYLVAYRFVRKAHLLSGTAALLAGGDLTARVDVRQGRGGDELDATARALNDMAERIGRRARETEGIGRLREALQACQEPGEVREVVARLLPRLIESPAGELYLISPSRDDLVREGGWGEGPSRERCAPDDCWAVRRSQRHAYDGPAGNTLPCGHLARDDQVTLCVPLIAQDTLGFLCLCGAPLDADRLRVADVVAETISLTVANLRLRETLRNQAIRDPLTSLYNRRFFEESFEREAGRARRRDGRLALLLLDVDHFKRFNDTHGHPAGDALLRQLARTLAETFRSSDVICRIGGEEFGILLPDTPLQEAARRAETLRQIVAQLSLVTGKDAVGGVTISIGVAAYPEHGELLTGLLESADAALYRSKQDGRDRVTVAAAIPPAPT